MNATPTISPSVPAAGAPRWRAAFAGALALGVLLALPAARAHVTLEQPKAPAESSYRAVFRVGHGCEGTATHTLRVLVPEGFRGSKPMPKAGWALETKRAPLAQPYESHGRRITEDVVEITWRARSREAWLEDSQYDEFVLHGQTPARPGALWFKVLQTCERGQWDWAEVPATGTSTRGLRAPAVLLEVQAGGAMAAQAAPTPAFTSASGTVVAEPWVRGTVPQQKSTGLFAQITSAAGGRLVSASSPVAGVVEIHQMTMEGSVMRMRAVGAVDLPAGRTVEFSPGGYHVMLMDLKQPLNEGDTVPVTLVVQGKDGKLEPIDIRAPVRPLGAAGAAAAGANEHKH